MIKIVINTLLNSCGEYEVIILCDNKIIEKMLPYIVKRGDCSYYFPYHSLDALGDILTAINFYPQNQKTQILISGFKIFLSKFYSIPCIVELYEHHKKTGTEISVFYTENLLKEQEVNSMNSSLKIICPPFEETGILKNHSSGSRSKRDYSHPTDGKIIRSLDSPAVNAILKPVIELVADYSQGQVIAQSIPVNESSFSEINDIVNECVEILGIKRPYVVVDSRIGFNAYTTGSDEEPFIVIGTSLLKCVSNQQLRFIIGHECGHIAMGHVMYHALVNSARLFTSAIPIIGNIISSSAGLLLEAWSRRSEITADRAGLLCCGNVEIAKRSLLQMEGGFVSVDKIDIDSYLENSRKFRNRSFMRRIREYSSDHPITSKRIEALALFAKSEKYYYVTGQPVPDSAISDSKLEREIENLLKVM